MNNTFLKSTLILSIATLTSKILGSIFRIPLQNIAGDEVLGIFSLVYPVYMVALTLSVAGIPIAISKLISEALVHNDKERIHQIYRTATILTVLFGLTSFTFIYSFSGPISTILGGPSTRLALIVVALTLLIAPYMAVYRGYFQGFQDMRPTAISQVLEQFIRVGFILAIAYILVEKNFSNEAIAGGVMAASSLGALASAVYLLLLFKKSPLKPIKTAKYTFEQFKEMSKTILIISLPICVGAITMALINFVDSITIPMSLRSAGIASDQINYTYGIYGRGLSLVQIATVFSSSIVLPLIPLMTKMLTEGKRGEARSIIERTHKLTHLISWPAALGLFALTLPLNLALFKNLEGSAVLSIIGLSAVFTSLTILGTGILQGMNLAKQAAYIVVAGVIVKVITNIGFIKAFGLIGAGYSTLFVYLFIFAINTYYIRKSICFTIWRKETIWMIVSSVIMGAVIGLPTLYFHIEQWSRTTALMYSFVAMFIGAFIYFALLFATKTINLAELTNKPIVKKILQKMKSSGGSSTGKNGKGEQKLKRIASGLLILALLLSLPGIVERFKVEWNNRAYELVIPYESIDSIDRRDPSLEAEEILTRLKGAGLQGVSLEPDTLKSLEQKGLITTFTYEKIKQFSLFSDDFKDILKNGPLEGLFVVIHEKGDLTAQLSTQFEDTETHLFQGKEMIFIPGVEKELTKHPLGFSMETVQLIKGMDLSLILRLPNITANDDQYLFEQALQLADEQTDRILFLGNDVIGQPQPNAIKRYADDLKANGFGVYTIEFADQKGFYTFSNQLEMDVIRLHSLNLNSITSPSEGVDRAVRAVKERNIRSLFITMKEGKDPADTLESTEVFMKNIQKTMPSLFHLGKAETFDQVHIPKWSTMFTLLAATLFVSLAALTVFKNKWLFLLSLAGLGVISLGYLVLDKTLLVQGLALLVAIVTPVFAILPLNDKRNMLLSYGRAILISIAGIAIVVGLLNGNEYLVGVELFRGVKLIYVFPIAFMFIYAIWGTIRALLGLNVKYWHLIVIGIIGVVGLYYISRTGNAGSVSSLELTIRQLLEEILYVRPRTKEFLIGFPLYILALYILPKNKKLALFLLIPGVIGFLSIVNTFTHLHIPLYVSLLRTAYSLVFGLVIGYIFIFIYKIGYRLFEEQVKPRWFS